MSGSPSPKAPSTRPRDPSPQQQRGTWIEEIVAHVVRRLRSKPPEKLRQLAAAPSLALIAKPKPDLSRSRRSGQFARPPSRPVDGPTRPLMRIAIVNHKGGVGKTSTAINLSAALAEMDYRVLVFDCDSQGDLSAVYAPGADQLPTSIANLFDGTAFVHDLIRTTQYRNVSVITADERLNTVDKTHGFESDANATCLADAVAAVQADYDYVLFDCPPRPHLTAFAALCAATHVVIPCEPSQFSVRSMVRLMEEIELARRTFNPRLHLLGYFLSKVANRSRTQDIYRRMLVEEFGEHAVLKTAIPVLATFEAAINLRKPVVHFRPRSRASAVIRQFTMELISVHHDHRH
ncbi:MAG: ParA family protein [candidate division Zixibacteria bacterium]|nr:ParA family protein [candidate division Zixibacteria bacterium]